MQPRPGLRPAGAVPNRLQILSLTPIYPSESAPASGVFVKHRLEAMYPLANIRLLALDAWYTAPRRDVKLGGYPVLSVKFIYFPMILKQFDGYFAFRSVRGVIRGLHTEQRIEVIDAHFGYPTGVAAYMAGRALGIPVIITIRGCEIDQLRKPALKKQLINALNQCAGVVAVSEAMKTAVVNAGVAEHQVKVIANAVDFTRFQPGNKSAARKQLGLSDSAKIIVTVAKLNSVKRLDVLAESFATLHREDHQLKWVIVGGKDYDRQCPGRLERLLRERNLSTAVHMTGNVPPEMVPKWLHAADLFALASDREGSSNAVREALACGLPVVATRVGDNGELVIEGKNGMLVTPNHVNEMTHKLRQALSTTWNPIAISDSVGQRDWNSVGSEVVEYIRERTCGFREKC